SGHPEPPRRRGPIVRVDGANFRASVPLLQMLVALDEHEEESKAGWSEMANVRLVARLHDARQLAAAADDPADRDSNLQVALDSLDHFKTVRPDAVGLMVTPQPDGSLSVEPDLGPAVDREQV